MRKVFIQTYGCQMNEYDSAQMVQILESKGFVTTDKLDAANLILINSCSVREKSETKALSNLGRLAELKKSDPSKVIGFGGCVGQTEGPKLLKRFPFLDFAFGTNNYRDLPEMIQPFEKLWDSIPEFDQGPVHYTPKTKSQAFLTITNGCDKFCSYCIVPFTRGREVSRSPEEIVREASHLVSSGVSEIMLLGQNVNSYWGMNKNGNPTSLYELLKIFHEESEKSLKGLKRLRYTTSHPRDFDESLARAYSEFPILCEYLHLPFQSGSDSVLRRMRRFYTAESFLKKMEMVRKYCPDIALSTDIIVGFPGETREDFEATMKIIQEVEFDNVYAFKYSVRPYTRSATWQDDVPAAEKSARIEELISLQKRICVKKYREDLGRSVEVMLEGPSKLKSEFWTGRTRKNRVVHIPGSPDLKAGQYHFAHIQEVHPSWMRGNLVSTSTPDFKSSQC